MRLLDPDRRGGKLAEWLPPDREHRVRGSQGLAQDARLLAVELLGVAARLRVREVEVAGDAQQLVRVERLARGVLAERDVGVDRREVAAAVEDDRQLTAERQAVHAHRDRGRLLLVDQRAAQQLVRGVVVPPRRLIAVDALLTHRNRLARPLPDQVER